MFHAFQNALIAEFLAFKWFLQMLQGMLLGVAAMLLHESGHIVAAILLGLRVKKVGLKLKGIYTVREAGPPHKSLLITLAGPMTNIALISSWHSSHMFALANFCYALANLLPIEGSDGSRALDCLEEMRRKRRVAA